MISAADNGEKAEDAPESSIRTQRKRSAADSERVKLTEDGANRSNRGPVAKPGCIGNDANCKGGAMASTPLGVRTAHNACMRVLGGVFTMVNTDDARTAGAVTTGEAAKIGELPVLPQVTLPLMTALADIETPIAVATQRSVDKGCAAVIEREIAEDEAPETAEGNTRNPEAAAGVGLTPLLVGGIVVGFVSDATVVNSTAGARRPTLRPPVPQ
mmetsp:Transcript_17691/g.34549  ORF Transcript_17691/g.34549 Transcript_17691/m.34549 type:complete len:214 (-) Transcript_17691:1357-1998(-)